MPNMCKRKEGTLGNDVELGQSVSEMSVYPPSRFSVLQHS